MAFLRPGEELPPLQRGMCRMTVDLTERDVECMCHEAAIRRMSFEEVWNLAIRIGLVHVKAELERRDKVRK